MNKQKKFKKVVEWDEFSGLGNYLSLLFMLHCYLKGW